MKIEFINHAGYLIHGEKTILCDPWINGSVFNNGWRLLLDSKKNASDFKTVDYIWISHEHPDHFDPKFFNEIDSVFRKKIKILFQYTRDKRVITFLKGLGFQTIELPLGKIFQLDDNIDIICDRVGISVDSYLMVEMDGIKILNLNDCQLTNERIIKNIKKVVGEVDILFNQFNYANWLGNENNKNIREKWAFNKIVQNKIVLKQFCPKYFIPFASFCYYSHIENWYMNDSRNSIEEWYNTFNNFNNTKVLIMAPGSIWQYESPYNSESSIKKYEEKLKKIKPESTDNNISYEILSKNCVNYINKYKPNFFISIYLLITRKNHTSIYIWDYESSYIFNFNSGLTKSNISENQCDFAMSSDSLNYIFNNSFGVGTLSVNARFRSKFLNTKELSKRFIPGILTGSKISIFILIYRLIRKKLKY